MYNSEHKGSNRSSVSKITVPEIRKRKQTNPIVMVTAYDFTMAKLLDEAGTDILLVGDSLGMVFQGNPNTLSVTLENMIYHCKAVTKAAHRSHVVGDMPFMSYQVSVEHAIQNAGRLIQEGHCESVKLEGGKGYSKHVESMVLAGIPVMGHIGLMPQSVHTLGGFKVQGKTSESSDKIIEDAMALEDAGAYAIVLEAIPADLAEKITMSVSIPTIGIGAGKHCDGQVLVCYDLLGMVRGFRPKFVKTFANLGDQIVEATHEFINEIRSGNFPSKENSFSNLQQQNAEVRTSKKTDAIPPHWYTH